MKISDLKKSPIKKTSNSGNAGTAKKTNTAGSNQSQASNQPGVSVSGSTGQIANQASAAQSERAELVAKVKLEVDSGTYEDNSYKTAEKIVDSLNDYSLA